MLRAGDRVAVSVPASSANLGPGFDAVGLGLGLRDEYAVHVTSGPGLVVEPLGEGVEELPVDETHLVARALRTALEACGLGWTEELAEEGLGLHLQCRNAIPMSAGLGSSAAALVGGLALGFALARGGSLTEADLVLVNTHAGVAEGHPDNSSASVYGGMTVSWMPSPTTVRTARLTVHEGIEPLVLLPQSTRLSTSTARGVLPAVVPRADAVQQAARAALLTHAMTADPTLLLDATQDWLHQEQRRGVYPESMGVVDELRSLGHAAMVSGAGPAVLVLARAAVAEAVVAEVRSWGRTWRVLRPGVATTGVQVEASDPHH
ncbi:homoserine kinase [Ornithinimicrobium cavernae]|uniref:homoserine kinase n=1 Tax=Ornithinimicrobium cavernae TaxID=2666047 RepID=UPI001F1A205E|nr:homoserine kinase [Ornithinimicrobium cavernae]